MFWGGRAIDHATAITRQDDVAQTDVVDAASSYRYEVHIHPGRTPVRRWRGRVVAFDPQGRRHYWRWHSARNRDRLLGQLWREAIFDIRWRTGRTASIEIVDH